MTTPAEAALPARFWRALRRGPFAKIRLESELGWTRTRVNELYARHAEPTREEIAALVEWLRARYPYDSHTGALVKAWEIAEKENAPCH